MIATQKEKSSVGRAFLIVLSNFSIMQDEILNSSQNRYIDFSKKPYKTVPFK